MKNNKLLKWLLPTTLAISCLPLATITSCNKQTTQEDFVIADAVQKSTYGSFDEESPSTSLVEFDGFALKDGYSIDDLEVSVENCDFEGVVSTIIEKNSDNTFKVKVFFQADYYLYKVTTKFDLAFSHKSSKGHIQTVSGLEVEFTYYTFKIAKSDWSASQILCTSQKNISYITSGVFQVYTSEEELLPDLSNFYVEVTCFDESITASAEIVQLYSNTFVIKLNLENISDRDVVMCYTIKNKKMPTWYEDLYFNLTISSNAKDAFTFYEEDESVTLQKCNLQDASVEIPAEYNGKPVTTIGKAAFQGCCNLRNLKISKNVNVINSSAFYITYIDSIVVDEDNASFTSKANDKECNCVMVKPDEGQPTVLFRGCAKTEIPNTITKINEHAFTWCLNLKEISLPDSVETIGQNCFEYCFSLKKVNLNKLKTLHGSAFGSCWNLEEISLGSQLQTIIGHAFYECRGLKTITIPSSVESISNTAFEYCSNLEDFIVDSNNPYFTSTSDGKAIHGIIQISKSSLIHGCKNTIIPTTVTTIDKFSFYGRLGMSSLEIPANVETIEQCAFAYCSDLKSVKLSGVKNIYKEAFKYCYLLNSIDFGNALESIGASAFINNTLLRTITLPSTCTDIDSGAFGGCILLSSVTLPEGLINIGSLVFDECWILSQINFPSTLKTIGENAFRHCSLLTSVDLSNTKLTSIDAYCFRLCSNLKEVKLPSTCTTIDDSAFSQCTSLTTITASNLTSIGKWAFYRCGSMPTIDTSKVTTLGTECFYECHSLTEVDLSSITTEIPKRAFAECDNLVTVKLPQSTNITIGEQAFINCTKLQNINLSKVTEIDIEAFSNCIALKSVDLSSATTLSRHMFVNCASLETVTLSSSLTTIPTNAFINMPKLNNITIPASVTTIEANAFTNCSGLISATFADQTSVWTKGSGGEEISIAAIKDDPAAMAKVLTDATSYDLIKKTS